MKEHGRGQRIAVTVWGERISPVFDSARTLLVAEIEDNALANASYLAFDPDQPQELVRMLRTRQVMILICGAISEGPATLLEAAGFELIPFIAGDVLMVLEKFLQGQPFSAEFRMPGCGKNALCCRGKIRRGRAIGPDHGAPYSGRGRNGRMSLPRNGTPSDGGVNLSEGSGEVMATRKSTDENKI